MRARLALFLARFDTLATRVALVALIGVGAAHLLSLAAYRHAFERQAELADQDRLADRLVTIRRAIMRVPAAEREAVAHDLSGGPYEAHWSRAEHATPGGPGAQRYADLAERLRALEPELQDEALIIGANRKGEDDPHLALVSMRLPDQSWANVSLVAAPAAPAPALGGALLSTTLMAAGAAAAAALVARWLARPLGAFAAAAQRFAGAARPAPLPERGPREVRALADAFNDMQRRIAGLIEARTQALAAVSHDLKTPITRLRFRAEDIADAALREAVVADLADMERMIDQTLALLRGERDDEPARPVDLVAILETIVDAANDSGGRAQLAAPPAAVLRGRRLALKRAFANLVDNAVKYGGAAEVSLHAGADAIVVTVEDRGPGIAPADVEKAFAPFVRLEPSRNATTGGFGLGLAIARAVIEGHRGEIALAARAGGGLAATVRLPLEGPRGE